MAYRYKKRRAPVSIGDAIRGQYSRNGHREERSLQRLFSRVRENAAARAVVQQLLEERNREHLVAVDCDKETLTLYADSSAWAMRIQMESTQLLKKLSNLQEYSGVSVVRVRAALLQEDKNDKHRPDAEVSDTQIPRALILDQASTLKSVRLRNALVRLANAATKSHRRT